MDWLWDWRLDPVSSRYMDWLVQTARQIYIPRVGHFAAVFLAKFDWLNSPPLPGTTANTIHLWSRGHWLLALVSGKWRRSTSMILTLAVPSSACHQRRANEVHPQRSMLSEGSSSYHVWKYHYLLEVLGKGNSAPEIRHVCLVDTRGHRTC